MRKVTWPFWLLCVLACFVIMLVNSLSVADTLAVSRSSIAKQGKAELIRYDSSKGVTKNGTSMTHIAVLQFKSGDQTYPLFEFPNQAFRSTNWDSLNSEISVLINLQSLKVYCSIGFNGCHVHNGVSSKTKMWLLISLLGIGISSYLALQAKMSTKTAINAQ